MDDHRFGRVVRALRLRRHWRQGDLAAVAGVSQQLISKLEHGHGASLSVIVLRRVAAALEMRLSLNAQWRGSELDRLLDADHAALQARARRLFESQRWLAEVEVTFSRYGERGSIDLLAFYRATRTLVVVEVKTMVADMQSVLRGIDSKARLAREIARERGWQAQHVLPCLLLAEGTTNRRRVVAAEPLLARFSLRAHAARAWLGRPVAAEGLLVFVPHPPTNQGGGRRAGRQRMRLRRPSASVDQGVARGQLPSNAA
jgi:transcriptional regulator with XRE-family HTH domain